MKTKGNKPDKKEQMLYDSTCMRYPEPSESQKENRMVVYKDWGRRGIWYLTGTALQLGKMVTYHCECA